MASDHRHAQRGFALVLVLWVLALMTVMTLSYSRAVRTETRIAGHTMQAMKARAIAQAGIWLGVRELLDRNARANDAAQPLVTSFAEGSVTARFLDQEGLVDLNAAGADLLELAARAAGIDPANARDLVATLIAHRERRAPPRNNTGESRPTPFRSVEELRDLPGITPDVFARLRPLVTVHSGRYGIDPQVAPAPLAGAGATTAQQIQSSRRLFAIVSEGVIGDATQRVEAVIRLGGPIQQPYAVYAWREGLTDVE